MSDTVVQAVAVLAAGEGVPVYLGAAAALVVTAAVIGYPWVAHRARPARRVHVGPEPA